MRVDVVVSVGYQDQVFEANESADQYKLHCSQQPPAKEIVWFPVTGPIVIIVARDVIKIFEVSS